MKILLADSNHSILHELLIKNKFECDLFWDKSTNELIDLLPNYDGLVIRSKFNITKELLDKCTKLKCIGRVGAGMENIDVAYAMKKKIICLSVPEGNRDAVGEHALAMILMLFNNLKKADGEVRNGIWNRIENRGLEIKDKKIGLIGFGNMGSSFAKKLKGFECKINAYDKYKFNFGNDYVFESSMQTIFDESDIISLHVPLTEETRFIINENFINKFKKPIYIINTARGKCINTLDLVEAIKNGKVKGACLDVLEYESNSFENAFGAVMPEALKFLFKSEKVLLTPHIAGWTEESNYKMSKIIAEKMISALNN